MKKKDYKENAQKVMRNKRAMRNYHVIDEVEAGIVLLGTEIKSIRLGKVSFKDSYAQIKNREVILVSLHISPYKFGNINNHDPIRERKLLLNKRQIKKFKSKIDEQGMTLIPKDLYVNEKGICKITLALAKGKKLYDKREDIKKKDLKRENQRNIKNMGF
ncbi:MAG: SsrA-binding protein SmpB [Candidatus Cloacimonadota bacterium]|nr:SsrA-binding protein SmpB [Candidatus Cloacimonadota bacterium]